MQVKFAQNTIFTHKVQWLRGMLFSKGLYICLECEHPLVLTDMGDAVYSELECNTVAVWSANTL